MAARTLRGIATLQLAARWMARGSNDPTMWAVIRRGSSLLGTEDMGRILPFLAPGLPLTIHQVAIQAVESKSTIAVDSLPKDVTDRVAELAQLYVTKASVGDAGAEVDALAAGATASTVLAQAASAPQIVATVVRDCPPRVSWLAANILSDAIAHRAKVRADAPEIPGAAALAATLRAAGCRSRP
jgi:hypothetical protein